MNVRGDGMQIIMDDKIIEGISLNEYYLPNMKGYKGVFFMIHGHTSSKDYGTGLFPKRLAELGYYAIALDAYKHGMRKEEPYISGSETEMIAEMPSVIYHTSLDIQKLYQKYYSQVSPHVSILGISMGAMIAWQMPKHLSNLRYLIALIGTPNCEKIYRENHQKLMDMPEVAQMINKLNVIEKINDYQKTIIYCANGSKDLLVDYHSTQDFISQYKNLFLTKPQLKIYDTAHDTPNIMIDEMFEWLNLMGDNDDFSN